MFCNNPENQPNYVQPMNYRGTQYGTEQENQPASLSLTSNHQRSTFIENAQVDNSTNEGSGNSMSRSPFFISLPFFHSR